MGRSSTGRSASFHPGSGRPLVGRRFSYGEVPVWDGLFGDRVVGEYGERLREDPVYKRQVVESIVRVRQQAREEFRNIRDTAEALSGENRQNFLESSWINYEAAMIDVRDQYVLYRNTPIEPVLRQSIKSQLYILRNIERLYDRET
jgi:hypothetical protein